MKSRVLIVTLLALLSIPAAALADHPIPVQELVLRAKPAVALVTARGDAEVTVLLSNGAMLPAEVKKFSAPLLLDAAGKPVADSGRDLALIRVKDGVYPALALDENVKIGDPVRIMGFPGVVLSHELLNKTAALEASVTTGAVSGLKQDAIGQDVIQTDASAAPGNSGGPAVGHGGAVVGVLTFVSLSPSGGSIVQGFNFLIPARDVKKFLQGTEVTKPGESPFNPVWAAGLRDLGQESFKSAAAKFGEANKLLPDLPDVKRALAEAEFKVKNPPPRPFPWAWVTLGLALVSGGGYGAMWYRRWQRNRFRVKAGDVVKMMEAGVNPLLLDVRQESAAKTAPLKIPGATYISPDALEQGRAGIEVDPNRTVVAYCT